MAETVVEDRIVSLLKALQSATRSARFAELEAIRGELETILDGVADTAGLDRERLRTLVEGNIRCLAAMADGIRAGQRRLQEIASARRGETYDPSGKRFSTGDRRGEGRAPTLGQRL